MVAAAPPHPHPLPRRRNPAVGRVLAVAVSVPLEPPTPPEPPGPVCGSACPLPRRVGAGRTGLSESSPRGLERLCTSPAVAATAAALPAPFAPRVPIGRARVLTMCVFPRRCVGFEGVGCVCVGGDTGFGDHSLWRLSSPVSVRDPHLARTRCRQDFVAGHAVQEGHVWADPHPCVPGAFPGAVGRVLRCGPYADPGAPGRQSPAWLRKAALVRSTCMG